MTAHVIAPRVGKFIRLLGSEVDGEIVAAVQALRRQLAAAGRDLHDLAAAVEQVFDHAPPPDRPGVHPGVHAGVHRDHPAPGAWPWPTGIALKRLAARLADEAPLSASAREFCASIAAWRRELTPKQQSVLHRIFCQAADAGWRP